MKFQLVGTVEYWEEIHTDGISGNEPILEEFEADNITAAIEKAKELAKGIVSRYPVSTMHGCKDFNGFNMELRTIESVWNGSITPKKVEELKRITVTENQLSGNILV